MSIILRDASANRHFLCVMRGLRMRVVHAVVLSEVKNMSEMAQNSNRWSCDVLRGSRGSKRKGEIVVIFIFRSCNVLEIWKCFQSSEKLLFENTYNYFEWTRENLWPNKIIKTGFYWKLINFIFLSIPIIVPSKWEIVCKIRILPRNE